MTKPETNNQPAATDTKTKGEKSKAQKPPAHFQLVDEKVNGLPGRYALLLCKGEAGRNRHAFAVAMDKETGDVGIVLSNGKLAPLTGEKGLFNLDGDKVRGIPAEPLVGWGTGGSSFLGVIQPLLHTPLKGENAFPTVAKMAVKAAQAEMAWSLVGPDVQAQLAMAHAQGIMPGLSDKESAKIAAEIAKVLK